MTLNGNEFQESMLDRFLVEGRMREYGKKNDFKNIKKFISENLQKSIAKSEQTLKDKLSDAQLKKMAKTNT